MTFDELVDLCSLYCDECEVMAHIHCPLENKWRLLSLQNFGVNKDTRGQLESMIKYATDIEFVEIRPEVRRILWSDITK